MFNDGPKTPLRRGSQRFLAENRPFISSTNSTGSGRDHQGNGGTSSSSALSALKELEEAFEGIADEMEIFVKNVEEMEAITELLEESAESMAMFLQAQRMNTFCVEFPQAPTEFSFARAAEMAMERARERARTPQPVERMRDSDPKTPKGISDMDKTFATNSAAMTPVANPHPILKRPTKPVAMTNKMRKERAAAIDSVVNLLPIEYRGNDAQMRKTAESVIGTLMDAKKPLKIGEIAKGPTLQQAKVNKCLIALIGAKAVHKSTEGGVSHYSFVQSCLP